MANPTSVPAQDEKAPPPMDPAEAAPRLTPTDPNLVQPVRCPWPVLLTKSEIATAACLADVILPADERSAAASKVGVQDFINEWVSAPYPDQMKDREIVRGGLAWLNTESHKRFEKSFCDSGPEQRTAICDDICSPEKARPEHLAAAKFFNRFRDLCLTGFYTTAAGRDDLGYRGNMPTPVFSGPPPEVLKHLGLA